MQIFSGIGLYFDCIKVRKGLLQSPHFFPQKNSEDRNREKDVEMDLIWGLEVVDKKSLQG